MPIGIYRLTSNIIRTLVGNKIVHHADVFGALPVSAAPTTFCILDLISGFNRLAKTTARQDKKHWF